MEVFLKKYSFLSLIFLALGKAQEEFSSNLDTSIRPQSSSKTPQELSPPPISSENKKPTLIYGFDFDFFADNLENSSPFWDTRTIISTRLMPEIGVNFFGQNLRIGGYFTLDMGEKYPQKWGTTLSYDFKSKEFSGFFGIFSKKYRIGQYPLMFFRNDYDYFHPLINGAMFQYQTNQDNTALKHSLEAELILDWYGGDLKKRIDEFLVQGSLKQSFWNKLLFWGASFVLYHTKNDGFLNLDGHNFDTYLLDRLYYQAYLGSNLTHLTSSLDNLSFQFGILSSLERKRRLSTGLDPFSNQFGWQFESDIAFRGFGINNHLYWGDKQYKYFHQYGEDFYAGLPFYQNTLYNRTEFYYSYQTPYLKVKASFILHFTPKQTANQQMITIVLDSEKLLSLF